MERFTWCPRIEPKGTNDFRTLSAQFGDGYVQEVGDGINNETRSWNLSFRGKAKYIKPIRDFLRAHKGYLPFEWRPPLEEMGLYKVTRFEVVDHGAGSYSINATFEQRFAP